MLYIRLCPSFSLHFLFHFKYFYFSINFDKYTIFHFIRLYHLIFKINILIFLDILWVLAKNEELNIIIHLPYFSLVINFVKLYFKIYPSFNDPPDFPETKLPFYSIIITFGNENFCCGYDSGVKCDLHMCFMICLCLQILRMTVVLVTFSHFFFPIEKNFMVIGNFFTSTDM